MAWISPHQLVNSFGLSRGDAERIVREESWRARCRGWSGLCTAVVALGSLLWVAGGAQWLFPGFGKLAVMGMETPGLLLMVVAMCLPRLFAHDAIVARALHRSAQR